MISKSGARLHGPILLLLILSWLLSSGCSTPSKIDWDSRLGVYRFDDAILDLGPPDKSATLSDGTIVAEWLLRKGMLVSVTHAFGPRYPYGSFMAYDTTAYPSPDWMLRLVFTPEGTLKEWKKFTR